MPTALAPPSSPLIFLSHASEDTGAVRELARELERAGFRVWVANEQIGPGESWMSAVEAALHAASCFAVYVGRSGVQRWVDREVKAALLLNAQDRSFRIVPVLGPGAEPTELPLFLREFQHVDLRTGIPSASELHALWARLLAAPASSRPVLRPDQPPFKGLATFQAEDALLFFGRDREVEVLLDRLRAHRFLAVLGDSGSGKSSLVRAGLLPAVQRGQLGSGSVSPSSWRAAILRPGDDPFRELASALLALLPEISPAERVRVREECSRLLADGTRGLYSCIAALLPPTVQTLLVVDQFEELLTAAAHAGITERFVHSLLEAVDARGEHAISVVITLRADFYPELWHHRQLLERVASHQYPVSPPSRERLLEMMEGPLRLAGAEFEPGLAQDILSDLGDEPGGLSLLEHALLQLWDLRRGHLLTHGAYEAIGRLQGALQNHAEAVYRSLESDEAHAARRIFIELTQLGDEAGRDTRRRAAKAQVLGLFADRGLAERTLSRLVQGRLITTGREGEDGADRVEVAHETLIRGWVRLREWVRSGREDERQRRRLASDGEEWVRNRDPETLYRGARLDSATGWAERQPSSLTGPIRELLEASLGARRRLQERECEQRERETRSARRVRRLAEVLAITAALALSALIIAYLSQRQARQRWHEAESRALAAQAISNLEMDPLHALAQAIAAAREAPTREAGQALRQIFTSSRERLELKGAGRASASAFRPDGRRVVTLYEPGARIWDTATGRPTVTLTGTSSSPAAASFSPDGQRVAIASLDGKIGIWDANNGRLTQTLSPRVKAVLGDVAFSPRGNRVVGSGSGMLVVWDLETGSETALETAAAVRLDTVFGPNGADLVTLGSDQIPRLWDAAAHGFVVRLEPFEAPACPKPTARGPVLGSAPPATAARASSLLVRSGNGRLVAVISAAEPGRIKIWDTATRRLVSCISGPPILDAVFSPNGEQLLGGSSDTSARLWDVASGRELEVLRGHTAFLTGVGFGNGGETYITASADGTARLWRHGQAQSPIVLHGDRRMIVSMAVSRDGQQLLTLGFDRVARLWDLGAPREPEIIALPRPISGIDFRADGRQLMLYDGATATRFALDPVRKLDVLTGLSHAAFSPDLAQVATVGQIAQLQDTTSGRPGRKLSCPGATLDGLYFNRDGSRLVGEGSVIEGGAVPRFTQTMQRTGNLVALRTNLRSWPPVTCIWDSKARLMTTLRLRSPISNVSRDGRFLTEGAGGTWITDVTSGRDLVALATAPGEHLERGLMSPMGDVVASWTWSGPLILWDAHSGRLLRRLAAGLLAADISPDGKRLLTLSSDAVIRIWNAMTGQEIRSVQAALSQFGYCHFSPDGHEFLAGGVSVAAVWDTETGNEIVELRDFTPMQSVSASFSPDSRRLVVFEVGSSVVRLYSLRTEDLLHKAEATLPASAPGDLIVSTGTR